MSRKSHRKPKTTSAETSPTTDAVVESTVMLDPPVMAGPTLVKWTLEGILHVPRRTWLIMIVGLVITGFLYSRTLDFPMVFDDRVYLENNPFLKDSANFAYPTRFVEFANEATRRTLDPDLSTNFILRPVAYLTFHLNYIFSGYTPRWYRIFNIAFHLVNGLLVFFLGWLLVKLGAKDRQSAAAATFIATAAALWFSMHPLATESVTYITQRFTSMGALFYLLTLIMHFGARLVSITGLRRLLRIATAIVLVIGMLTKETLFTAPLMAVLLDCFLLRSRFRDAVRHATLLLVCMPLIPFLVFLISMAQNGGRLSWLDATHVVNLANDPGLHMEFIITQITVVVHYLRMIVWPSGQSIDPDWDHYDTFLNGNVMLCLFISLALLIGSFLWSRKSDDIRIRIIFAGIVWYFLSISVSSGMVPLPDMVAEHRSYLPSVGIFFSLACLLHWLQSRLVAKHEPRWLSHSLAGLFGVIMALTTIGRNETWSSRTALWEDATRKAPDKYRVWGNLGCAYDAEGRREDAVACFEKARGLESNFLNAYVALGSLYGDMKQPKKALEVCLDAIKVNPKFGNSADLRYNAAVAHLALGNIDNGLNLLKEIVLKLPTHRLSHLALARVYFHQKKYPLARQHLHRAEMLGPLRGPNAELAAKLNSKKFIDASSLATSDSK